MNSNRWNLSAILIIKFQGFIDLYHAIEKIGNYLLTSLLAIETNKWNIFSKFYLLSKMHFVNKIVNDWKTLSYIVCHWQVWLLCSRKLWKCMTKKIDSKLQVLRFNSESQLNINKLNTFRMKQSKVYNDKNDNYTKWDIRKASVKMNRWTGCEKLL